MFRCLTSNVLIDLNEDILNKQELASGQTNKKILSRKFNISNLKTKKENKTNNKKSNLINKLETNKNLIFTDSESYYLNSSLPIMSRTSNSKCKKFDDYPSFSDGLCFLRKFS